jgi:hypothetical protein
MKQQQLLSAQQVSAYVVCSAACDARVHTGTSAVASSRSSRCIATSGLPLARTSRLAADSPSCRSCARRARESGARRRQANDIDREEACEHHQRSLFSNKRYVIITVYVLVTMMVISTNSTNT